MFPENVLTFFLIYFFNERKTPPPPSIPGVTSLSRIPKKKKKKVLERSKPGQERGKVNLGRDIFPSYVALGVGRCDVARAVLCCLR